MEKPNVLTKLLAVIGTVLVWLPILAPLFFSVLLFGRVGQFRLDYLMPAELFLLVLVGGSLLVWAALRVHSQRALIGGGLTAAVVLLVAGQALAVVTGLASGEIEPVGWPWALVIALIAAYVLAVIVVGVGGLLLTRQLFTSHRQPV